MVRITREEAESLGKKIGAVMRKPPAPSRKEREIQAAILEFLRTVPGVVAWRQNVGAVKTGERFIRFGVKGISDIIGWRVHDPICADVAACKRAAHFLAIEVKKPGEHPTQEQAVFLKNVAEDGGIAIVARSVDDVVKGLGLR